MVSVLLTAFEPFDGQPVNASLEVAREVISTPRTEFEVMLLELPVVRERCEKELQERLDASPPEILLMLGEAGTRTRVTPERIAINWENFRIPDNAGARPGDQPIDPDGPAGYMTTLPVDSMVEAMRHHDIPAEVSYTAGQYVCNRLFYRTMQHIDAMGLRTDAGFLHLPFLHEQALSAGTPVTGLSRQTMIAAVDVAIEIAARHIIRV